jgi:hypothetical protein
MKFTAICCRVLSRLLERLNRNWSLSYIRSKASEVTAGCFESISVEKKLARFELLVDCLQQSFGGTYVLL